MNSAESKAVQPRSWRQFSILSLLVVTSFCAVLVAWWRDRTELLNNLRDERMRTEQAVHESMIQMDRAMRATEMARMREQKARAALEANSQLQSEKATNGE